MNKPPAAPGPRRPSCRYRLLVAAAALALAGPAPAQHYANEDLPDWREDPAPPPPAYSTQSSQLINVDMPAGSSVKIGIDPATISINKDTGIVRYVVVARGPSAVNASYEGIRCATGEYKVYARQTPGNPWSPDSDSQWKPMRGQTGVAVTYPAQLAQGGLCKGAAVRQSVDEMARELRSGNQSLYQGGR